MRVSRQDRVVASCCICCCQTVAFTVDSSSSFKMSVERPGDPVSVNPSTTATAGGEGDGGSRPGDGDGNGDSRPGEFSPEQLVLIDRLITARVTAVAATTGETPETSLSTGTGEGLLGT